MNIKPVSTSTPSFLNYSLTNTAWTSVIPYTNVYGGSSSTSKVTADSRHLVLHAKVVALNSDFVTLDRSFPEYGLDSPVIPYRYAVYALGSLLPKPIDLWSPMEEMEADSSEKDGSDAEKTEGDRKDCGGTKQEGIKWLQRCQDRIRKAGSVLCVGGGALGIRVFRLLRPLAFSNDLALLEFATDIKSLYPEKQVTLLHSRHRLLPRFDYDLHSEG